MSRTEEIDSHISPTQQPVSREDMARLGEETRVKTPMTLWIEDGCLMVGLDRKHLPGQHDQSTHGSRGGGGFTGKPANPKGKDTEEQYRTPDGGWTPERKALHDQIVADFKKGKTPVDDPTSYMMGGGPAAGKSSLLKSGQVEIPENTVKVDSDEIKGMLPEYQSMLASGDSKAATFVHEESSYLSKRLAAESSREGYNVMLDGTGDNSIESLRSKVEMLRNRGQKVVGIYASVPTDVAVARSNDRAERTGRYVPEVFIRGTHASVSRVVPEAVREGLFDEVTVYDTTGRTPRKLLSSVGAKSTVHDQVGWDTFVAKGAK